MPTVEPDKTPKHAIARWAEHLYRLLHDAPPADVGVVRSPPPFAPDHAPKRFALLNAMGEPAVLTVPGDRAPNAAAPDALEEALRTAGTPLAVAAIPGVHVPALPRPHAGTATGPAGSCRIDLPASWLLHAPVAPPPPDTTLEMELLLDAPHGQRGTYVLGEGTLPVVLLDGPARIEATVSLDPDCATAVLHACPGRGQAPTAPGRAVRFSASVVGNGPEGLNLRVAPRGHRVDDATTEAAWVTDGTRFALRFQTADDDATVMLARPDGRRA